VTTELLSKCTSHLILLSFAYFVTIWIFFCSQAFVSYCYAVSVFFLVLSHSPSLPQVHLLNIHESCPRHCTDFNTVCYDALVVSLMHVVGRTGTQ